MGVECRKNSSPPLVLSHSLTQTHTQIHTSKQTHPNKQQVVICDLCLCLCLCLCCLELLSVAARRIAKTWARLIDYYLVPSNSSNLHNAWSVSL